MDELIEELLDGDVHQEQEGADAEEQPWRDHGGHRIGKLCDDHHEKCSLHAEEEREDDAFPFHAALLDFLTAGVGWQEKVTEDFFQTALMADMYEEKQEKAHQKRTGNDIRTMGHIGHCIAFHAPNALIGGRGGPEQEGVIGHQRVLYCHLAVETGKGAGMEGGIRDERLEMRD